MIVKSPEDYVESLVQLRDAARQRAFISDAKLVPTAALVEALAVKVRELCSGKDPALAEILAETNLYLASTVDTPMAWAFAKRSRAHVLYTMKKCVEAQPYFEQAVELFSEAGLDGEKGRTLVTELDNLIYLSRYEDAVRLEGPARAALQRANDPRHLTNLEIALGNLYYRLNRFSQSLSHYDAASSTSDNPISTAAIGIGKASVLTDMNRFDEAIEAFETTIQHCEEHGLTFWADIATQGLSRMYFLRGNYSTALRLVEQVRRKHESVDDKRRVGLCDIDRAEIYLQLNLFEDASALSAAAFETFQELNNRYEAATCLNNRGIAEFKLLNDKEAEAAFTRARELFVLEGNEVWVASVDVWLAQLLIRQQKFSEAQDLARRAAESFDRQQVPVRAASARVLSAQSLQELEDTVSAMADAQLALRELEGFHAPWVSYQAYNMLGHLKERNGALQEAEDLYLRAISDLESLRGNIRLDELRMSFGKDKYQVYENIVNLKLQRADYRRAFDYVERSKSRTLIDLLERNLETVWDKGDEESPHLQRVRKIREELNILYSRLNEAGTTGRAVAADTGTKEEIARRERELVEVLREAGSEKSGWATLQNMESTGVDEVQKMLEPDEVLVEYYTIEDRFYAFVIARDAFDVVPDLTTTGAVRQSLKGLNFQLSKFHLKPSYIEAHTEMLFKATQYHLGELYKQLIEPLKNLLKGRPRLIVVPHQVLHYVPFQALFEGSRFLIDDHEVTYGASATVLKICRERISVKKADYDLILAVADERTPYIYDEAAALHDLLPTAKVFLGEEAREEVLREFAPSAGKIHIAAHGIFRSDNPMFSSLRLGDTWLNLFDIFNLQLGAELTTLSACETGMSTVWEGDELLGLARGFLYAGTPSLVVSLWTVNDRSTSQMMLRFYKGLQEGLSKSRALREAIIEVKAAFPHPYYWAPFILLGKS